MKPTAYTISWSREKFVFQISVQYLTLSAFFRDSLLILQEEPQDIILLALLQRYPFLKVADEAKICTGI
jgi:hypothetical protein